jgi:hypothetical protein
MKDINDVLKVEVVFEFGYNLVVLVEMNVDDYKWV